MNILIRNVDGETKIEKVGLITSDMLTDGCNGIDTVTVERISIAMSPSESDVASAIIRLVDWLKETHPRYSQLDGWRSDLDINGINVL